MTTPQITLQVSLTDAGNIIGALNSKANELVGIINLVQTQVAAQVTPVQPPAPPAPPEDGQAE